MLDNFIWWIGVIHIIAYALAAFVTCAVFATSLFAEWLIKRLRLKGEMLKAYRKILEEREAAKRNPA
ncbi:MAG: hypothetical protein AAGB23_05105 [Pseudomonadota bacterium]